MGSRSLLLIIALGLGVGLIFGGLVSLALTRPQVAVSSSAIELAPPEQDDFIIMTAEAYAGDHDLKLARDRLTRLHDEHPAARVEKLALTYAPQRDLVASYLALLATAMGSRDATLLKLSATATPTATPTATFTPTFTATNTPTPTFTNTPTALSTFTSTPTNTPTLVPPTRPPTRLPPTATPTFTAVPPPPDTVFEPDRSRWPGTFYFEPAAVQPGQGYWHLVKAIYCDAFDSKDPHRHDFDCDEMPGGPTGTNIYVMTNGNPIDVIRPDGTNVGGDRLIVGDKKSPKDMCNCTYSFMDANYRVSVAGAPSDAVGGFCMCSVNFGWGSHAHVRYFLYFEYINR
jgi:hypothetical protein